MPPISLGPVSGRYLSFGEREEIAILRAQGVGVREIGCRLGRSASTISRELRRNASTRSRGVVYRATTAQWHAERRASRPKVSKLAANDELRRYVQGRGGLQRGRKFVTPEVMITQRPAEADDRAVPAHWEGDLILGLRSSAIGTLVERTTRHTMLLHLPPMAGHREGKRIHNGPALAVRDAIAASVTTLPEQLRNPKGTDLSRHSRSGLDAVAAALNSRPRKTLGYRTPAEALTEHLNSLQQSSVATTP